MRNSDNGSAVFITFEGIEGCGKSTQSRMVFDHLQQRGTPALWTRQPGGCDLGVRLRSLLLGQEGEGLTPLSELLLYLADRAQHVAEVIRPALAAGTVVLCDRFTDSTVAYQGYGRGLDVALIHRLNTVAVDACQPDLTLILDLPVETGLARARTRNADQGQTEAEGRFEAEEAAFHQRVRDGYLALAAENPGRSIVIPADGEPEEVFGRVWAAVCSRLELAREP